MPKWIVKATWREDEAEASAQWEVEAASAHDAVREATMHIRYLPHHVEAKLSADADKGGARNGGDAASPKTVLK